MQTDSLHSGSISFGRFENEPLCWERRSSFSHNRYLEEVEKCSKPGSVVEKKAYFEAHFKRKALLLQDSSECESARGYHADENDVLGHEVYIDEFNNVVEGNDYDQYDETAFENMDCRAEFDNRKEGSHFDENVSQTEICVEEFDDGNEGSQFDYANEDNQYFDESPEGSKSREEFLVECEREDPLVLPAESQVEAALGNADIVLHSVTEDVNPEKTNQIETGRNKSLSSNDEPEMDLKGDLNGDAVDVEKSSKPIDFSPESGMTGEVDKASSEHRLIDSPKVWIYIYFCLLIDRKYNLTFISIIITEVNDNIVSKNWF